MGTRSRALFVGWILGISAGAAMWVGWCREGTVRRTVETVIQRWDRMKETVKGFEVRRMDFRRAGVWTGGMFEEAPWLTVETFNGGRVIVGEDGVAWLQSPRYQSICVLRSTSPLPPRYKVRARLGFVRFDLDRLTGLTSDPAYPEGPLGENGCYLLTIVDELPKRAHTNIWWHQHRKVFIDVDNNENGHGMPRPIFMGYANNDNRQVFFDAHTQDWTRAWRAAGRYPREGWFQVEIEKTHEAYRLTWFDEKAEKATTAVVPLDGVWHADESFPDVFVLGDPHENFYAGAVAVDWIEWTSPPSP